MSHRWLTAALMALALLLPVQVQAHEGHDHGTPQAATSASPSSPRFSTRSEQFDIVGIMRSQKLTLYVDRASDNAPVANAKLSISIAGEPAKVSPQADGTYLVESPHFTKGGKLDVVVAVEDGKTQDLLIAELALGGEGNSSAMRAQVATQPAYDNSARGPPSVAKVQVASLDWISQLPAQLAVAVPSQPVLMGLGVLVFTLGFVMGAIISPSSRLLGIILLVAAMLLSAMSAYAHEGHDHGVTQEAQAVGGDTPRRLPDGSLFAPKPTQRLLDVRTTVLKPERIRASVTLPGRIIADPAGSAVVQSLTGGRILALDGAFPQLGQRVTRGEALAEIEPTVSAADVANLGDREADLTRELAGSAFRLQDTRTRVAEGNATRRDLIEAQINHVTLLKRRERSRIMQVPQTLAAPIDGVIVKTNVVQGQVVQPQDIAFQIIDPERLWVEATVYDAVLNPAAEAYAETLDGQRLTLAFKGRSRALEQQAALMQFAIQAPVPELSVGAPVSVFVQTGQAQEGLVIPRAALVRSANGEQVVFEQVEPEVFVPQPVRIDPLDGERVVVRSGLKTGQRVVVRAAELLNQVR